MFLVLIACIFWMAVYALLRQAQKHGEAQRRRRQAMTYLPAAGAPGARMAFPGWKELGFGWLNMAAALQEPMVPRFWAEKTGKLLQILPAWQDCKASQWLALKESAAALAAALGWLLSAPGWAMVLLGIAGFCLPDLWLQEQCLARRRAILRELPNMLDLLACCLDAGLAFETALGVIVEKSRSGFLRPELGEMQRRLRMGRSRREAWEHLSRRLDDPEITALTGILVQAERLGTKVSHILQNQAARLRSKHAQQVEKAAQEAPVKLLFPLVLFIFPVVFIILFGPILLRLWQGLGV